MAIKYYTEDCSYPLAHKREISRWLTGVAREEGKIPGEITVILCSDQYLLEINRRHLGHDYFTDIITFDYSEDGVVSGDLFVSVETVASNAKEYGAEVKEEMERVLVHGVLHLCGYGDKSDEEAFVMRSRENYYLAKRKTSE